MTAQSVTRSSGGTGPEGWVPAERRWLGVDRRTVLPALGVLVLALLFAVVLPVVNSAVPYDDVVTAGHVLQLDHGVRFAPAPGWGIVSGVRVGGAGRARSYPASAVVEKGAYTLTARVSAYRGTAAGLLERQRAARNRRGDGTSITGRGFAITTAGGLRGRVVRYAGSESDGTLAAIVADGVGVEIMGVGAPGTDGDTETGDVQRMIRSVRVVAAPR